MATSGEVTARDRGLCHGMRIQREFAPAQWRERIDEIRDNAERDVAREYLRAIWQRTKAARAARELIERRQREQQLMEDAEWL